MEQIDVSLVQLLKQEEAKLRQFMDFFNSAELAEKFPCKIRRLSANSTIEPSRSFKISMETRHRFITSALLLFFNNSPERIGLDKTLLEHVREVLNGN